MADHQVGSTSVLAWKTIIYLKPESILLSYLNESLPRIT